MVYMVFKLYLLLINSMTFLVFGLDKWKARRGKWRISEKTLFALSLMGGSIGAILGMWMFRHKTRHKSFTIGVPFILLFQILTYWFVEKSEVIEEMLK